MGRRFLRVLFVLLLCLSASGPARAEDKVNTREEVRDIILEDVGEGRPPQVSDADGVTAAAKTARSLGKDAMVIWMNESVYRQFVRSDSPIFGWLREGGVRDCTVSYSATERRVHVQNIQWR